MKFLGERGGFEFCMRFLWCFFWFLGIIFLYLGLFRKCVKVFVKMCIVFLIIGRKKKDFKGIKNLFDVCNRKKV